MLLRFCNVAQLFEQVTRLRIVPSCKHVWPWPYIQSSSFKIIYTNYSQPRIVSQTTMRWQNVHCCWSTGVEHIARFIVFHGYTCFRLCCRYFCFRMSLWCLVIFCFVFEVSRINSTYLLTPSHVAHTCRNHFHR